MSSLWRILAAGLLLLTVAGCSFSGQGLVDADQPAWDEASAQALEPGQPMGQTFVARHSGLAGVEFFLLPEATAPPTLTLHLRTEPQGTADLATASLQFPPGAMPGFHRFSFPPVETSHGQYYYAFLDAVEPGVSVALSTGEAYLDGAAHQDHQPLDAQTTFHLVYAPRYIVLDLLKAILEGLGLLAVAGLLFVVPGWALLAWLLPGRRLAWAEMLGLTAGVGLALYPVLFLWTHLLTLNLGPLYAWLPAAVGLVALAWRYRSVLRAPRKGLTELWSRLREQDRWPDAALLGVLGLVFGVRLLVVRGLEAPMWGDGYQHTMIAQLLADNNGLFDSWAPYAELDRFTYHFGFHSSVSVWHWVTRLPVVAATLWTGQLVNGLAVLALYPLAVRVTGSRWGGVWAVLLAGLLSPMPMFYTNWGRYTQVAGQVILPALVWLTWEAMETPQRHGRLLALVALVGGGLALTHYRVFVFYGVFVLALTLVSLRRGAWRETFVRLGWMGAGVALLFFPWFANTIGGNLLRILGHHLTTPPAQSDPFTWQYNAVGNLETYLSPVWWLALVLGLGVGLWHRQRRVLLAGLWWFLLLVVTNPSWLSLPGTGVITNFALFIAAYLPAALFSGILFAHLARPAAKRKWVSGLLALVVMGMALWGAQERMGDLMPARHALVTHPDVRAAAWIQENTPTEARFLVNSAFAYGGSLLVGTDGGWWLPLLAGRQNTVPPLTYGGESQPESDYWHQVDELARQIQKYGLDDPTVLALLRQQGVTHVYVGQRQGRVNYSGPHVLAPEELQSSRHYRLAYHQDRVWIFEINPQE